MDGVGNAGIVLYNAVEVRLLHKNTGNAARSQPPAEVLAVGRAVTGVNHLYLHTVKTGIRPHHGKRFRVYR